VSPGCPRRRRRRVRRSPARPGFHGPAASARAGRAVPPARRSWRPDGCRASQEGEGVLGGAFKRPTVGRVRWHGSLFARARWRRGGVKSTEGRAENGRGSENPARPRGATTRRCASGVC
jgi:hypothetical protein